MVLLDPIVIPSFTSFEFERLCKENRVKFHKYDDAWPFVDKRFRACYSINGEAENINVVMEYVIAIPENLREYESYNNEILSYVNGYRFEKYLKITIFVLIYLIIMFTIK